MIVYGDLSVNTIKLLLLAVFVRQTSTICN